MTEADGAGPVEDAGPVRDEDAFDVEAVRMWLAERGRPLTGEVTVAQFGGGASNLTFSLRTADEDLVLRRPPAGHKAAGAHDMSREYHVQDALAEPFGLVPTMVGLCDDAAVIGQPFYVMERVDGLIPRRDLPPGVDLDRAGVTRLCRNAIDTLVRLHRVEVAGTPLAKLGKGSGYVGRQVTGWSKRYQESRTPDAGDYETVMAWLAERQPDDVGSCLVHNDFRFDNLVLDRADPTRLVALLDWEMATVGDPLMDLGGTMAYWTQADDGEFWQRFRRQPTNLPGMFTRAEVVDYYAAATGWSVTPDQWRFYEVFGVFRLGVIAQQIYYRYFHGQTHNPAYAVFGPAARELERRCLHLIAA